MNSAMMHYRPWPQYQHMPIEQHPYYQFVANDMHIQYSMNDHPEDDYDQLKDEMPSEMSEDQNHNPDVFRLAFAASQWSKLVLNAEGLFNKLMSTNALPSNEQDLLKNQIEQWLCMKQEYEECIAGDECVSLHGYTENARRSLERIEEVTETDEKTDESEHWACEQLQLRNKSCSSASLNSCAKSETYDSTTDVTDDSDQSDVESENSDFIDKLEESMKKFGLDSDVVFDSMKNDILNSNANFPENYCSKSKSDVSEGDVDSRNNSPEPDAVACTSLPTAKPGPVRKQSARRTSILPYSEMSDELAEFQKQNSHLINVNLQKNDDHHNQELIPLVTFGSNTKAGACLMNNQNCTETVMESNSKSESIKLDSSVVIDSEHLNTLRNLRMEILEKQSKLNEVEFTMNLLRPKIKELQNSIRERKVFLKQHPATRTSAEQKYEEWLRRYQEKCHRYEKLENKESLKRYRKKLKVIEALKEIVDTSKKTRANYQAAIIRFEKEMDALKLQYTNQEKCKEELDSEIADCQKKVKQLEEIYNPTTANLKKILCGSEDRKSCRVKVKAEIHRYSKEAKIKASSIDDWTKEKLNCNDANRMDEKESLRKEIRDLRHIRDLLIKRQYERSSSLKYTPTTKLDREALYSNEFIECIDAMMEEKNVMICSKIDLNQNSSNKLDDQTSIFNRLEKLSHRELVTLFYKYFNKVVDLKENSQNLEVHNIMLENTLQTRQFQYENQFLILQEAYENKLALLLNYYPDESSSSVCDSRIDKNREIVNLLKENQNLKQRVTHFESLVRQNNKIEHTQSRQLHSHRDLKSANKQQLMHPAPQQKATVYRRGNKLVFQK